MAIVQAGYTAMLSVLALKNKVCPGSGEILVTVPNVCGGSFAIR